MKINTWTIIIWTIWFIFNECCCQITDVISTTQCPTDDTCENKINNDTLVSFDNSTIDTATTSFYSTTTRTTTTTTESDDEGIDLKVDFDNIEASKNISITTTTTIMPVVTTVATIVKNTTRQLTLQKQNKNICPCDLTVLVCDINCCCDTDCHEYQLEVFSKCYDIKPKNYDSQYCFNKNFIKKNNTKFILDRLADNLFCISKENTPPLDSAINSMRIKNREKFNDVLKNNHQTRYSWIEQKKPNKININVSSLYIHGDVFWIKRNKKVKKFELPLKGFTGQCSMIKEIEYLNNWQSNCLQINLRNENPWINPDFYSNITVISLPKYLNTSINENCTKNICIPVETKICTNAFKNCNSKIIPRASCVNETCVNIVKKFEYTIYHNGSDGIKNVKLNIQLGNFTRAFNQQYEIKFQWINSSSQPLMRSGSLGYLLNKPIIFGTMLSNASSTVSNDIISFNTSNYIFKIPLGMKDSKCSSDNKYPLVLGEDVKSKCKIIVDTDNFTANTCMEINQKIITAFFDDSLVNITDIDNYPIYISRSGNTTNLNATDWNQILLNRIPKNIVTAKILETEYQCSGLFTSIKIDLMYGLMPKMTNDDYYKIVGAGITVSDEESITWERKCFDKNNSTVDRCIDTLSVDIITYVSSRDISTPEMYYYAGGPNLDLILPYDFFYPFLSRNNNSSTIYSSCIIL
ncbi:tectonic-1, partial [Aphidius gifuensis]|uniref:tectonic-1 n=1 Tax=Aphidius gifuensis TaxID=684658 RepID=UPI001CDC76C6